MADVAVCFVCLGNICRSPTAEGIFIHLVKERGLTHRIAIDSAGTAAYHVGEKADSRSRSTARGHGIELPSRARKFESSDFARFDYVVAMDHSNRSNLLAIAPSEEAKNKVVLLRKYDPQAGDDASVPDPYYGGEQGFEDVFAMCMRSCTELLAEIESELS